MEDLAANISEIEAVLETLPDEEVDSRLEMCKVGINANCAHFGQLKTNPSQLMQMSAAALEGLEAAASDLEARIAADGADALGSDADAQAMSVAVTGAKTRLVTARTQAEKAAAKTERAVAERRRRRRLLGEYQSLVLEMEHWTLEARGKAAAAVKMSSLRAVRDDIHATEVIEKAFFTGSTVSY